MAKKGNRAWTWMKPENKDLPQIRLQTERNKNNLTDGKLRVRKFHPLTKTHEWFVETKENKK